MLLSLNQALKPPRIPLEIPGAKDDWGEVEATLGIKLPEDYKEFIVCYGTGAIDGFLWVFNPFSANPHLNFLDQVKVRIEVLNEWGVVNVPYLLYPNDCGIIPWGATDNGDVLYWLCNGTRLHWSVVVNESRGSRWREYELSTTEFLTKLVTKVLVVDLFPDDFPSDAPEFVQDIFE